jgi:hypothetical protein
MTTPTFDALRIRLCDAIRNRQRVFADHKPDSPEATKATTDFENYVYRLVNRTDCLWGVRGFSRDVENQMLNARIRLYDRCMRTAEGDDKTLKAARDDYYRELGEIVTAALTPLLGDTDTFDPERKAAAKAAKASADAAPWASRSAIMSVNDTPVEAVSDADQLSAQERYDAKTRNAWRK